MDYRSRIVGHGEAKPEELSLNPLNWRLHPRKQKKALSEILRKVGWVQDVVVNKRTGHLVDGHLRVLLARENGEDSVPVTYVDLSPEEERLILLTLDPLVAMAEADDEVLGRLLDEVRSDVEEPFADGDIGELMRTVDDVLESLDLKSREEEKKNIYTSRVEPPIYEPRNERVDVSALYDEAKARLLLAKIERAEGITEDERNFLRLAAYRFVEFRFDRIADYYAQATPEMQRLMEDAALVIVDIGRAIELGFVRLNERLARQYLEEYGNEKEGGSDA